MVDSYAWVELSIGSEKGKMAKHAKVTGLCRL